MGEARPQMSLESRSGRQAPADAVVDPGLAESVQKTVHRLARQGPQVLRRPGTTLPRTAAYDLATAPGVLKGAGLFYGAAVIISPLSFLIMTGVQKAQGNTPVSVGTFVAVAVWVYVVIALLVGAIAWRLVLVPGGKRAVAEDLAAAQSRYLLLGEDLDGKDLEMVVRAQDAVNSALAAARFVTLVDPPNRTALAAGVWSMARRLAAGEPQGNGWAMIVAVEEYAERLEEASTAWQQELQAGTWKPGTMSAPLAKAVKRADAAGARAVTLAATV
ncbi:hypothetical protein AB0442_22920 [Kitasatospora sp. NPDC085895]|uniref:hypothetical protein n=1 Tax=Kitasatospora sp. NPDC085895 TaxID=3155057 RepID=UPI00344C69C6